MRTKKLNGLKIFGATLAASSAAIATVTLASCAKSTNRFNAIGGDLDREYNVSQAKFKALQNQFTTKYRHKLQNELPPDKVNYQVGQLTKSLNSFNDRIASDTNYSYSLLCSTLVEKASRQYGIKLVTESSAQWSDAKKILTGMQNSLRSFMKSQRMDRKIIEDIIEESDNKFEVLMNGSDDANVVGIRQKYDDPLTGIIQAKANILNCFDEVNTDIALFCATNRLKQFMEDYSVLVDVHKVKLDELEAKHPQLMSEKNSDLTSIANEIFTITRNSDNTPIQFSDIVLPGYKIKPVLQSISRNEYQNKYSLNIDWTCEKIQYNLNSNINKEKAIAHLYGGENSKLIITGSEQNLLDKIRASKPTIVPYQVFLTKEKEVQTLKKVYLGVDPSNAYTSHVEFAWDQDISKNAYEAFFQGEQISADSSIEKYNLNISALAQSGITIANVSNKPTASSSEPVRLDKFISSSLIELKDKKDNDPTDELINNFVQNCSLSSVATIWVNDSENHKVTNELSVYYSNSIYTKEEGCQETIGTFYTNKFPYSYKSYKFLVEKYNALADDASFYTSGKSQEAVDDVDFEFNLTLLLLGLGTLLNTICMSWMFLAPPAMPAFITILVLSSASQIAQFIDFGILLFKKYIPLHNFNDNTTSLLHSKIGDNYLQMLDSDAAIFAFPRAKRNKQTLLKEVSHTDFWNGYNAFNTKSWTEVKKVLDKYQHIDQLQVYKSFYSEVERLKVSNKEFGAITKDWEPKGWFWGWSLALNGVSLACDIAAACIPAAPDPILKKQIELTTEQKASTLNPAWLKEGKSVDEWDNVVKKINDTEKINLSNVSKDELINVADDWTKRPLPETWPKDSKGKYIKGTDYLDLRVKHKYFFNSKDPDAAILKDIQLWKANGFESDITQHMGSSWKRMVQNYGTTVNKEDWFKNWIRQFAGEADQVGAPFGREFLNQAFNRFKTEPYGSTIETAFENLKACDYWPEYLNNFLIEEGMSAKDAAKEIESVSQSIDQLFDRFEMLRDGESDLNSFLQLHEDLYLRFNRYTKLDVKIENGNPFDNFLEIVFGRYLSDYTGKSISVWGALQDVIIIR